MTIKLRDHAHFEPLKGKRQLKVTERRTKKDWAHYIKELVDEEYPEAEKIVLIQDNLNTHTGASLYEAFDPSEAKRILEKLEFHYTLNSRMFCNYGWLSGTILSFERISFCGLVTSVRI